MSNEGRSGAKIGAEAVFVRRQGHAAARQVPARSPGQVRWLILAALVFGLGWVGVPLSVWAQKTPDAPALGDAPPPAELTAETIQARLKKLDESKDLEETLRLSLIETYKKILTQVKVRDDFATKSAAFTKVTQDAPVQLQQIKDRIAAPAEPAPTIDSSLSLAQMQPSLTDAEARLTEAQKSLNDLQAEPKRRADRRVEIPKLQDAARKAVADIETRAV